MGFCSIELEALGTKWWIEMESEEAIESSVNDLIQNIITDFEAKFSRFRTDSLIYKLNQKKELIIEDAQLLEVLQFGFDLSEKTNGLFTPLAGTFLEKWGYDSKRSFLSKESKEPLKPALLEFSDSFIRISQDAYVDIGGYGKGWLVDKVGNFLKTRRISKFVINAGGDILVSGFNGHGEQKTFYLENPNLDGTFIGQIRLGNGAIASSSSNRRSWKDQNGKNHSHIVDIHNQSTETILAATYTLADSCLEADVSSTILLIDPDFPIQKLFNNVQAMIVDRKGRFTKSIGYPGELFLA